MGRSGAVRNESSVVISPGSLMKIFKETVADSLDYQGKVLKFLQ